MVIVNLILHSFFLTFSGNNHAVVEFAFDLFVSTIFLCLNAFPHFMFLLLKRPLNLLQGIHCCEVTYSDFMLQLRHTISRWWYNKIAGSICESRLQSPCRFFADRFIVNVLQCYVLLCIFNSL